MSLSPLKSTTKNKKKLYFLNEKTCSIFFEIMVVFFLDSNGTRTNGHQKPMRVFSLTRTHLRAMKLPGSTDWVFMTITEKYSTNFIRCSKTCVEVSCSGCRFWNTSCTAATKRRSLRARTFVLFISNVSSGIRSQNEDIEFFLLYRIIMHLPRYNLIIK